MRKREQRACKELKSAGGEADSGWRRMRSTGTGLWFFYFKRREPEWKKPGEREQWKMGESEGASEQCNEVPRAAGRRGSRAGRGQC